MRPVLQTIYEPPRGNCFMACVASILEVGIDQVPNELGSDPARGARWWWAIQDWLRPMGLQMVFFTMPENEHLGGHQVHDDEWRPDGYAIAGVQVADQEHDHALVALDGKFVWNPMPGVPADHPSIGRVRDWTIFQLLDPASGLARPNVRGPFYEQVP